MRKNMKLHEFNIHLGETQAKVKEIIALKGKQYHFDADRLAHFKDIAAFTKRTPQQALGGMMIKHTKSIYDMIESDVKKYSLWEEKVIDHIAYLCFLLALCVENEVYDSPEYGDISKGISL